MLTGFMSIFVIVIHCIYTLHIYTSVIMNELLMYFLHESHGSTKQHPVVVLHETITKPFVNDRNAQRSDQRGIILICVERGDCFS